MKKILICCAFPWLFVSCSTSNSVVVDGIAVKSGNRVGGKDFLYVKKGATQIITSSDNIASFRDGVNGVKWLGGYWAASDIAGTITGSLTSTSNAKTAASVTNKAASETTKRAGIQAVTDQKALDLEMKAMEMGGGL